MMLNVNSIKSGEQSCKTLTDKSELDEDDNDEQV